MIKNLIWYYLKKIKKYFKIFLKNIFKTNLIFLIFISNQNLDDNLIFYFITYEIICYFLFNYLQSKFFNIPDTKKFNFFYVKKLKSKSFLLVFLFTLIYDIVVSNNILFAFLFFIRVLTKIFKIYFYNLEKLKHSMIIEIFLVLIFIYLLSFNHFAVLIIYYLVLFLRSLIYYIYYQIYYK